MPTIQNNQSKSQSLADKVSQEIEAAILNHELAVGDRLPTEPNLMAQYNVGRSTIREAIKVLANLGLIEVIQGKGTTVIHDTLPDPTISKALREAPAIEAYEARKALEISIVNLACLNRNATDLKALGYYLEIRAAAAKRHSIEAYRQADEKFHEAIIEAAHNSVIATIYEHFWQSFNDRFGKQFIELKFHSDQPIIHQNILKAIEQQDVHLAIQWTKKNRERKISCVNA